MQSSCMLCQAPLRPEDIQWDLAMARCPECLAVYDVSGHKAETLAAPTTDLPSQPRAPVPLPWQYRVEDVDGTLRISWRWLTFKSVKNEVVSAVLLNAFTVLYVIALVSNSSNDSMRYRLMASLCYAPIAVLGVVLAYLAVAALVNRTTLEVSRNRLAIHHGPLRRVWSPQEWKRRQLTQLYGKENVHRSDDGDTTTYDLMARDDHGKDVRLLPGLEEAQQVLFLEQQLERRLGIADALVEGEVATRPPAA